MTESVEFLPLGGSGEIGMNLNLYHYNNQWLMVDCGVTFGHEMGIELLMPDIRFIEERRENLVGIVLTHAHEDHIGALPHLWKKLRCDLYATKFTSLLIQDKLRQAGILDQVTIHEIDLGGSVKLGDFDIEFVTLTHSIPEPNALAITTPAGVIVHTGDWKIDPEPVIGKPTDKKTLKDYGDKGVLALVCDSTNVLQPGHTGSEASVKDNLTKLIAEQTGKVAITLFASNVARVRTCALAAAECGRQVVLAGRSLHRMTGIAKECGYLDGVPEFISEERGASLPKDKVLYLCTGSQGESRAALAKIATHAHPKIRLGEGDTVIFSSREIPGNELEIYQVQNRLAKDGIHVIKDQGNTIHVSGHPAQEDLKEMYALLRPQILIPVHGEECHMQEQSILGKKCGIPHTVVPYNGAKISLDPDNPRIIDEVPNGRWCVDGNQVIPFFSPHIKERVKLSQHGVAFVTIFASQYGKIQDPMVNFVGLCADETVEQKLRHHVTIEMEKILKKTDPDELTLEDTIEDICRVSVRRAARDLCGKTPAVVTHIVWV